MSMSPGSPTLQKAVQLRNSMHQNHVLPLTIRGTTVLEFLSSKGSIKGPLGRVEALNSLIDLKGSEDSPFTSGWNAQRGSNFEMARARLQGLVDRLNPGDRSLTSDVYAMHHDVDEFLRRLMAIHDAPLRDLFQKAWPKDDVGKILKDLRTTGDVSIGFLEETAKRLYQSEKLSSVAKLRSLGETPAPDFNEGAESFFKRGVLYAALKDTEAMEISQGQFDAAANRFGRAGDGDASAISRILAMLTNLKMAGTDLDLTRQASDAALTLLAADRNSYDEASHEARFMYGLLCAGYKPHWHIVHSLLKRHMEQGNQNPVISNCKLLIEWVETEQRYERANRDKSRLDQ